MIKKNEILYLIKNRLWSKITFLLQPSEIIKLISFKKGLILAYKMLNNDEWDEHLQDYAVELLYVLRDNYQEEWNTCWEYDALLGLACDITNRHEERYKAYKRAFDRVKNPPPRLLIEFARCCVCPGPPPISYEYAIELIMKALKEALYADGISLLCNIYSLKSDRANKDFWSTVLINLEKEGKIYNSPSIDPDFLVSEFQKSLKLS